MIPKQFRTPFPPPSREELFKQYVTDEMSLADLKAVHHVSISTVYKWLCDYEIPTRSRINGNFRGLYKEINGVRHKRCPCPIHAGPTYLPADANYFYPKRNGGLASWCIRCYGRDGRRVEFSNYYQAWIKSIVNRLGVMESCRRLEICYKTYWNWNRNPPKTLRRKQARAIVRLMRELRHSGEVRHKDSIRHGATQRGKSEKQVKRNRDLYKRHGDGETDYRRHYRERQSLT